MKRFLTGLAALAIVAGIACTPAELAQLQGVLNTVDSIDGKATIRLKDGTLVDVKLARDTQVKTTQTTPGSPAPQAGAEVKVTVDSKTNTVKTLEVNLAEAKGIIKSVDDRTKTVTINLKKGGEVSIKMTEGTKIEVEDKEQAGFSALRPGMKIEATFDPQTGQASSVEAKAAAEPKEKEKERGRAAQRGKGKQEIEGKITAIDAAARSVTIKAADGRDAKVTVNPGTRIKAKEGIGQFSDLKVDMKVEAKFNPVGHALEIEIDD